VHTELIHVGFDNHLALNRVVSVAAPGSAPVKRMVQRGKEAQRVIDLTSGRRTKAVVVLDNDWVALIAITPETFASRAASMRTETAA
jgi:extracellular matrix regulatory protein A